MRKDISLLIAIITLCVSCSDGINKKNSDTEFAPGTREGHELAKHYCSTCHQYVPPTALDKKTWNDHVLPNMGALLGIKVLWEKEYVEGGDGSSMPFKEWLKIVDFYIKSAPEKLEIETVAISEDSSLFAPKLSGRASAHSVKTTMSVLDSVTRTIYTSDAVTKSIYRWNNKLQLIDSLQLYSPAVHAQFYDDSSGKRQAMITAIGTIQPVNVKSGSVVHFAVDKKLSKPVDTLNFELRRPVQSIPADFDNDGLTDWLVCAFGKSAGGLYWYKKNAGEGYTENRIENVPGAVQAVAEDFNGDGWTDCMVLFAYESESIRLYINNKDGSFTATNLLEFSPVNGSTSFQLIDFNGDGLKDILYTCGDNADLSTIFKPYHGVYIYLNKGDNKYEQSWFHHINGCSKAIAADFDQDGDIDIATIAFYADFKTNPSEKFIYFNNTGKLKFNPLTPPLQKYGRWLTMDAGDYDGDGDTDIILGNFANGLFIDKDFTPNWNEDAPFTVLENKKK